MKKMHRATGKSMAHGSGSIWKSRRDALRLLAMGTASVALPPWIYASVKDTGSLVSLREAELSGNMAFPGIISSISEASDAFSFRVSFDLDKFRGKSTAAAQISVPMTITGEGFPSLRLFETDTTGSEKFIAAVTPNLAQPSASFQITDFFNERAPLEKPSFLIRSVPGPENTIRLTSGKEVTLTVSSEAHTGYSVDDMLLPVWASSRMINETLLPVSRDGAPAEGHLLFSPERKALVMNYTMDKTYREGKDYVLEGNLLRLTPGSSIPFLTENQLYPDNQDGPVNIMETWDGGYVAVHEGFQNNFQLAVTYEHREPWTGTVPAGGMGKLRRTKEKLRKGIPLKVALLGDSISVGASSSGRSMKPPYVPGWGDLLVRGLRQRYPGEIDFVNISKGGGNSNWGRDVAPYMVVPEKPDICILAFGINDGNGMPVETYIANTRAIMEMVLERNPDTEFVLVASMLKNERWRPLTLMNDYLGALKTLESETVAVSDVWSVSEYILKTKQYWDISGNMVNHPNDFMVRVYAQVTLELFFN